MQGGLFMTQNENLWSISFQMNNLQQNFFHLAAACVIWHLFSHSNDKHEWCSIASPTLVTDVWFALADCKNASTFMSVCFITSLKPLEVSLIDSACWYRICREVLVSVCSESSQSSRGYAGINFMCETVSVKVEKGPLSAFVWGWFHWMDWTFFHLTERETFILWWNHSSFLIC